MPTMALTLLKRNAYRSMGKLFRNILLKEAVPAHNVSQPRVLRSLILNCQQNRIIHFDHQLQARDLKKLYEIVQKGKDRGTPVWAGMTVKDFAGSLKRPPADVCEVLQTVNPDMRYKIASILDDTEVIKETCKRFRVKPSFIHRPKESEQLIVDKNAYPRPAAPASETVKRPPVVTVMGHVDHGKTTLLDTLRNTQVVKSEFGGITQHIGAFIVKVRNETITFMDTPGHAAFKAMRERGARATDIVVLVVAADDGVMEQTVESIRMAKEAQVPIIVAVNKIDKPQANIENTLHELANWEVVTENLGGDVQAVPVSALTGEGLDALGEAILAQADIMELRADPKGFVEGVVIESKKDPYRGNLSTALIQRGTLRKGNILVAGTALAKVRLMQNHEGIKVESAAPSTPVEVLGWRELPVPGDLILQVESEQRAREVITYRENLAKLRKQRSEGEVIRSKQEQFAQHHRQERLDRLSKGMLKAVRTNIQKIEVVDPEADKRKLRLIIKGDVNGSVEAIMGVLATYTRNDECELDVMTTGVGEPTEADVELAELFDGIIYCFNLKISDKVQKEVEEKGIRLKSFNVIYHLVEDLKDEIALKLPPAFREEILGEAKVLEVFEISEKRKKWNVAGCECTSGVIHKSKTIKIMRDEEVLYNGPIKSLRHLKEEVNSIKSGTQCGILPNDRDLKLKMGDVVISYELVEEMRVCDWDPGF